MAAIEGMAGMTYPRVLDMCGIRIEAVFLNLRVQIQVQTSNHRRGALVVCIVGWEEVWANVVCERFLDFSCSIAARVALAGGAQRVPEVGMLMRNQPFSQGLQDDALASCLFLY